MTALVCRSQVPEVYTRFTMTGADFDPAEVTRELRINPTMTWRLGDPITPLSPRPHKEHGWRLQVGPENIFAWAPQLRELLDQLEDVTAKVRYLAQSYELECEIAGIAFVWDSTPSFHLMPGDLKRIGHLGAQLDMDIVLV